MSTRIYTRRRSIGGTSAALVGACLLMLSIALPGPSCSLCFAFTHRPLLPVSSHSLPRRKSLALSAQVTQQEAQKGIDKVVAALRKDAKAKAELGQLDKVTIVLGYGSPTKGTLAVRFNAAFKKSGAGLSSVPLPFGLGQSNVKEGRGTMVGQVKASINVETGKVTSCSVFRDLGYGRSFELKV